MWPNVQQDVNDLSHMNCNSAVTITGPKCYTHVNTNGTRNLPRLRGFVNSAGRCQDGTVTAFCIVHSTLYGVLTSNVCDSHFGYVNSYSGEISLSFFTCSFQGEYYCTMNFSYCYPEHGTCHAFPSGCSLPV